MHAFKKALFITLGSLCLALGLIGTVLPILPTTPLLLLSAFLFARSSDRALNWLLDHRWLGPYIRNYREGRGMAARDKAISLASLWLTIGLTSIFAVDSAWVRALLLVIAMAVTAYILRIKNLQRTLPAVERAAVESGDLSV